MNLTDEKTPVLSLKHIRKIYGKTVALDDVTFSCRTGEVCAILGENGAGKSTLIKILTGVIQPDEGQIFLHGEEVVIRTPQMATTRGIAAVYQELSLIPHLTVWENIFVGNEISRHHLMSRKEMEAEASALFERLDLHIDLYDLVSELSLQEKQLVEIAKAVYKNPEIIIFDEATSALDSNEVEKLFALIRTLREEGKAILFISHRMDEIKQIADCGSVFRDAHHITDFRWGEVETEKIVEWIVGDTVAENGVASVRTARKAEVLTVKNLSSGNALKHVNLTLYKGEILGLAGLKGHGQSEFLYALFGQMPIDDGEIYLNGKLISIQSPQKMIRKGIVLVPEERKTEGLVLQQSVKENITAMTLDKRARFGFVKEKEEEQAIQSMADMLHIKMADSHTSCENLSGGNQQKVVIGKAILAEGQVLLLADPTRGIDIGAKNEIYKVMNDLAAKGISILFYSTENSELVTLCDRIAVFRAGGIEAVLEGEEISERSIISATLGVYHKNGESGQ